MFKNSLTHTLGLGLYRDRIVHPAVFCVHICPTGWSSGESTGREPSPVLTRPSPPEQPARHGSGAGVVLFTTVSMVVCLVSVFIDVHTN